MKRGMIIGGGMLQEEFVLSFLQKRLTEEKREDTCLIAADKGLLFLERNGIKPDAIVGDFDSADVSLLDRYKKDPRVTVRRLNPEKDWTDTEVAAQLALDEGCELLEILGGTGGRIDHLLGNLQLLSLISRLGGDGYLLDEKNRIYVREQNFTVRRQEQWGKYFSLFAWGGDVTGLTLTGFKYQVEDFTLGTVGTRGVSNEMTAQEASVSFKSGRLLVVESGD